MLDIICKLCKLNKADQTHTPIIPFFLIENMINENREANNINLNASFDDLLFMEKFFKNDVKPINLKKLGRLPVKHSEKTNYKDIFVEDNILCRHCNAKFNMLDELFIEEFYDEFKQMDRLERDEFYYHIDKMFKYNILKAFFLSIVWRASIATIYGFDSFALEPNFEEKLRTIILSKLPLNSENTKKDLNQFNSTLDSIPIMIFCQNTINEQNYNPNNFVLFYTKSTTPYYIVINDFVVCCYYNSHSIKTICNKFFKFEKLFHIHEIIYHNRNRTIRLLTKGEWNTWHSKILAYIEEENMKNIRKLFIELFYFFCNCKPYKRSLEGFVNKIISNNEVKLNKDSLPYYIKMIIEYLDIPTNEI